MGRVRKRWAGLGAVMAGCLAALVFPQSLAAQQRLDLGVIAPPDHGMTMAAERISAAVEAKTDGALHVRVHHSSRRGNETAMLAQLGNGDLDAAILTVGELARHDSRLSVFFTPFLVPDAAGARRLVGGPAALALAGAVEERLGVQVLGLGVLGLRHMVLGQDVQIGDGPLFPPGTRMRVPPNTAISDFYRDLGADPQPLPLPVVREALAGNRLDGADMDLEIMALRDYEGPASHVILSGHMIFPVAAMVSAKTWATLSERERQTLTTVARDELATLSGSYEQRDRAWRETLAARGMTFLPPPRATLEAAAARWQAAHPEAMPLITTLRAEVADAP